MARMYPFPARVLKTESAEQMYSQLTNQLPPYYVVLYGRRWSAVRAVRNPDGECDFIIAKPNGAILLLELKGVLWERRGGHWLCYGKPVAVDNNPFETGAAKKQALVDLLKLGSRWRATVFPVDYAVALPAVTYEAGSSLPGSPQLLTQSGLSYLGEWVEVAQQVAVERNGGETCSAATIAHRVESLMRDYVVRLGAALAHDEERLFVLTEEQRMLDVALASKRRLTVQGCAGSGET